MFPRRILTIVLNAISLFCVSPFIAICQLESRLHLHGESCFAFGTNTLAVIPGRPGDFMRRAFYVCVLDSCSWQSHIGFGSLVTHRECRIGKNTYIGLYALVGSANIGEGCLIGSRASLISGGEQHQLLPDGTWSPSDRSSRTQIQIGANTWIGESAVVLADVGETCVVSAGSVVSCPISDGVVVAGNPARFARKLMPVESRSASELSIE